MVETIKQVPKPMMKQVEKQAGSSLFEIQHSWEVKASYHVKTGQYHRMDCS